MRRRRRSCRSEPEGERDCELFLYFPQVVSVLQRTPSHILKEIVLVDDASDDPSDGLELQMKYDKIKLITNAEREGLMR